MGVLSTFGPTSFGGLTDRRTRATRLLSGQTLSIPDHAMEVQTGRFSSCAFSVKNSCICIYGVHDQPDDMAKAD